MTLGTTKDFKLSESPYYTKISLENVKHSKVLNIMRTTDIRMK